MKLYFDIGNTNIKLNFVSEKYNHYISFITKLPYTVDSIYNLLPEEVKNEKIEKIIICSVVPKLTSIFEGLSKKYFSVKPWIVKHPMKLGVKININDPKILGSDLAALASYATKISDNTIIVNAGTTTTLIHVKDKVLEGAIIMAGLQLQINSIFKNAAKIPEIEINKVNVSIGKNNKDALSIGIINSQIFAIQKHIENIDPDAKVILSGGNGKKILEGLDCEYVKEATIEGMKNLEMLNEK